MKSYVLIEIDAGEGQYLSPWFLSDYTNNLKTSMHGMVRTADVTDLVSYHKTTPGDPWDKPYPAMLADMMERLDK